MSPIIYDLSYIGNEMIDSSNNMNLEESPINNNANIMSKKWMRNNKVYNIIKYDKQVLTYDMIDKLGLFRSVIHSNGKINVFSPPKSLSLDVFAAQFAESECFAEEFIEGTMINLFYDKDIAKWEIATKSSVGGNITYFKDQPTFEELFMEICGHIMLDFNELCSDFVYSFVMQHPKNKFVLPLKEMRLYLISIYKIDGLNIFEMPKSEYQNNGLEPVLSKMLHPYQFAFESFDQLKQQFGSMNTDINSMGIMIKSATGKRTKIRNPNYEYLKQLRGNNSKLQYQYLCLRLLNKVKEYLQYFPEARNSFFEYRKQIHLFTDELYSNYIRCYIKKEKPLNEFLSQFRIHMYTLHQHYLSIKQENGYIHRYVVIAYVNNLEPARLMYSLNYHLRIIGKALVNNANINSMEIEI
jgi:hypothetical protein